MPLLLNDIFDTVRELLGGWEEAELEVRFPDTRIYKHYKRFKRELSKVLKQGEISVASVSVASGSNSVYLGNGERHIAGVYYTDSAGDLIEITPASREFIIAAEGVYGTDTADYPTHYWPEAIGTTYKTGTATIVHDSSVYSTLSAMTTAISSDDVGKQITILGVNYTIRSYISTSSCTVYSNATLPVAGTGVTWVINGGMKLCLYPQPTTALTLTIQGEGEPIYETVAYDSDNMLATDVYSTIPGIFEDSCIEYLVWQCKRSAEEFDERREMIAEAQYEKATMEARRRWGMVAPASFWQKNNAVGQGPLE